MEFRAAGDEISPRSGARAIKSPRILPSYNKGMRRALIPALLAAAVFGQTPPAATGNAPPQASEPAPPEVDAALRARVTQFYQLEVAQKFNQALQMVAEDTKDLFVGSSKPTYHSFEIKSIKYSGDHTEAEVMTMVTRLLPIEGFMGRPLPTKMMTRWKVENGQWCYYVDPQKDMPTTPFGRMGAAGMALPGMAPPRMAARPAVLPGDPSSMPGAMPSAMPPPMPANLPNPRALNADKGSIQLKVSGPSADQVTISNATPWGVAITLVDPRLPGLTVKLDRLALNPGDKAILHIESDGTHIPKNPVTVMVQVQQTRQVIPVKVTFAD